MQRDLQNMPPTVSENDAGLAKYATNYVWDLAWDIQQLQEGKCKDYNNCRMNATFRCISKNCRMNATFAKDTQQG
jgi:hypothetical protein